MQCGHCQKSAEYLCASCGEHPACSVEHMRTMWSAHSRVCLGEKVNSLLAPAEMLRGLFKFHVYNVKAMTKAKKQAMSSYVKGLKSVCQNMIRESHVKDAWMNADFLFTFEHNYPNKDATEKRLDSFLAVKKEKEPHLYHIDLVCARRVVNADRKPVSLGLGKILHGLFLHWLHERDSQAKVELDAARVELIPYYGAFNYRVGTSCEDPTLHYVDQGAVRMILCDVTSSRLFTDIAEYIKKTEQLLQENVDTELDERSILGLPDII